jgi:DnaJ-class molecular chaperone
MAADPYKTLGLGRDATEKDVKSAYRKLAKELHPDRNTANPNAAERFSEVTQAYDLLADKDKRARFDRGEIDADGNPAMDFGAGGFGGGFGGGRGGGAHRGFRPDDFQGFGGAGGAENADIGDIFEGLFGGRGGGGSPFGGRGGPRAAPRGADVQYRLTVSLTDAAVLAPQRITLADGKSLDLKLPAGVEDGTQMRLSGKGELGPGGAGNAIITIQVQPHAFFRRDGDNLRLDLPVSLDEAVNGARVRVPTADGAVMLTVAPGTSSGRTLRLKAKGMTRKDGSRGDQLVTLEVMLPENDADLVRRLDGWHDPRDLRGKLGV